MPGGLPPRPAIDAMLMMRPRLRGIMLALPIAWLNRKMLRTFRFITLSHASSGWSSAGAPQVGAGVVDQDVDVTEAFERLGAHLVHLRRVARIGRDPARVDALVLQVRGGFFEVARLARREHDLGAGFAERLGDLQAEAARAAGDQRVPASEVEQLRDRCRQGVSPWG